MFSRAVSVIFAPQIDSWTEIKLMMCVYKSVNYTPCDMTCITGVKLSPSRFFNIYFSY